MKVLLLLAGRSRRFWPLKEKTLFPLCGRTLLEEQIDRLKVAGCTDIILVGGEHNIEDASKLFPLFKTVVQEDLELGMRGAMLSALPTIGDESVMIVGGNDLIESSGYKDLVKKASEKNIDGAILASRVSEYFPGGYLTIQEDIIQGIVEKPGAGKEPSDLVNIVAHIHNDASALLEALKNVKHIKDDGYELALAELFKEKTYAAVPYEGVWQPVKYPWHLLSVLSLMLAKIKEPLIDKSASVHPSAVIEGPVILKKGVKVLPNACIKGPCFIGENSIIGNNALVRSSSIGKNCVIGFNTEVKGSIVSDHVWTHMTYIGDSVIGRNVSFGGGSLTGNFRLDEGEISSDVNGEVIYTHLTKFGTIIGENTRLGIGSRINPGIKIGEGTFISGGTYVSEDIPEGMFARMKNGVLTVSENKSAAPKPEDRDKFKKGM